jgi:hypothetical protein
MSYILYVDFCVGSGLCDGLIGRLEKSVCECVSVCVSCVGSGLCDGLIGRLEKSVCECVCELCR